MGSLTAKEQILNKIKKALSHSVPMPFPDKQSMSRDTVFQPATDELTIQFAQNFTAVQGQFIYCSSELELVEQLRSLQTEKKWGKIFCREASLINTLQQLDFHGMEFSNFLQSEVAITTCERLIARTGSILMSSAQQSGRTTSIYTPVHICVAYTSQLVYDIADGLDFVQQHRSSLPSLITLATGPSRTADIEKTLVVGIHGPKEVFCFVIDDGGA